MSETQKVLVPYFSVEDVQQAIDVWTSELGFKLLGVVRDDETGAILHADLELDGTSIMVGPKQPAFAAGLGSVAFHVTPDRDLDGYYEQVRSQSGVTIAEPLGDQWWGERMFTVTDSLGYCWAFAKRVTEGTQPDGTTWEPTEIATPGE